MYNLLKGHSIVEGASFIAGPSATMHMAQMGAEIIRFDNIGGDPDFNRWPLTPNGKSLYWEGMNKGKKSVALDLSSPKGRELAIALVTASGKNASLFVTNFPVNGFLYYYNLKQKRDDMICLRVMGWADGALAMDPTINVSGGISMITGQQDDVRPVNQFLLAWDLITGTYAAFAMTTAIATVRTSDAKKLITVRTTAFAAASAQGGSAPIENVGAAENPDISSFVSAELSKSERPELTSAKIIISGGRGMGSDENFALVEPYNDSMNKTSHCDSAVDERQNGYGEKI